MTDSMQTDMPGVTVADRIRGVQDSLSPVERKIGRVLLARYPASGLQSSHTVAKLAGVSPPSVLRFLNRLGYPRYADFQNALRDELEERRSSPLTQSSRYASEGGTPELFHRAATLAIEAIGGTISGLSAAEFDRAVELVADPKLTVTFTGGRFSRTTAEYLNRHVRLMRAGTSLLGPEPSDAAAYLADQTKRDVLVAIDVRRYQRDTVELVAASKRNGARIVLLTDPWLSPATEYADVVMSARVEGVTVFDSLAPMALLAEMLASAVKLRLGKAADNRMAAIDQRNEIDTVD